MTQRIVEVAAHGASISSRWKRIVFRRGGEHAAAYNAQDGARTALLPAQDYLPGFEREEDDSAQELTVPFEDLGVLILEHPQTSMTLPALASVAEHGGVVVICGSKHLPVALCLPISTHGETVHRVYDQVNASRPLVKRLWQQVVQAKIRNQAANLPSGSAASERLLALAADVRSGDSGNAEATAAQIYWRAWLGDQPFKRDAEGDGVNSLLNYGYAIVRAAVARALVGSGFCCAIGLFHRHRANAFCLADDMLEPLRPLVDRRVRSLSLRGVTELLPESKRELYQLLLDPVLLAGQRLPLLDCTQRMSASLAACLAGEKTRLLMPQQDAEGAC